MRVHASLGGVLAPLIAGFAAACSSTSDEQKLPAQTVEELQDPSTCNKCHQDHFKEWSGSMHAYASMDPVFRAMNARGQEETKGALGDFCVKCHAPMAVQMGLTKDGLNLDQVEQKFQGVTCYFCHNVKDVTDVHNNPLVLSKDRTLRGGIPEPQTYGAHDAEYSKLFDNNYFNSEFESSKLCGSCHDISVPHQFSGAAQDVPLEQTYQEWLGSALHTPTASQLPLNCGTCHMDPTPPGPIANPPAPHPTMPTRRGGHMHDFVGVDSALTDFPNKDDQFTAIQYMFSRRTFRVLICADAPPLIPTSQALVQLENLGAGHYVPSGASQDRRIWVEFHAYRGGQEILASGVVPAGTAATTVPDTWLFYDKASKLDGSPAHMFWDVAQTDDSTVIKVATPKDLSINANTQAHPYKGVSNPDRITVTIWIEPIGLDVIDDMIGSTFLDASVRSSIHRFAVPSLTGDDLAPTADGTPVTYEWTPGTATRGSGINQQMQFCVDSAPPIDVSVTPPPLNP
jgi:hypothetical protein